MIRSTICGAKLKSVVVEVFKSTLHTVTVLRIDQSVLALKLEMMQDMRRADAGLKLLTKNIQHTSNSSIFASPESDSNRSERENERLVIASASPTATMHMFL